MSSSSFCFMSLLSCLFIINLKLVKRTIMISSLRYSNSIKSFKSRLKSLGFFVNRSHFSLKVKVVFSLLLFSSLQINNLFIRLFACSNNFTSYRQPVLIRLMCRSKHLQFRTESVSPVISSNRHNLTI